MQVARLVRGSFFVLLGCGSLLACAADSSSTSAGTDDGAAVDELNAASLRESTAIKGTITEGAELTLHYDASDREYPRKVPYLALEIVPAPVPATSTGAYGDDQGEIHTMSGAVAVAAAGAQTITIQGAFPGTPRALVVDNDFKVVSRATGQTQPDGSKLVSFDTTRASDSNAKRFLLVRDGLWSKPMDFNVHVGE